MAKVQIDSAKATATVTFTNAEENLGKLVVAFFDKDALISPTVNDSLLKRLKSKVVKKIVIDLNHKSIGKDALLALMKGSEVK